MGWKWRWPKRRPSGVPADAPDDLVELAERGDPFAMFTLGNLCLSKRDPGASRRRGFEYIHRSALAGYGPAAYAWGRMQEAGRGFLGLTEWRSIALSTAATHVPPGVAEAVEWYRRAANSGLPLAELRMGDLYATGAGVEWDLTQARVWFDRAAKHGSNEAAMRLRSLP
jgi:TPR repeat protein